MKKLVYPLAAALLLLSGTVHAQKRLQYCGELSFHYGPHDYRKPNTFTLSLVENAHFTPEVEAGIRGMTTNIGGDISYTLQAIPNHPRALATMAMLGLRDKKLHLKSAKYPVECYFDRAMRFVPDDAMVKAIYGNYLFALGRTDEALTMFKIASEMMPTDPTVNYNTGLAYFKKKDYANARRHAIIAYDQGFPLPGLKSKLVAVGQWDTGEEQAAAPVTQP